MTDSVAIRQAVYDHLAAWPGIGTIVWANTTGSGTPRIEVEAFGQSNAPLTFDGLNLHEARLQLTVVVDKGTGEADSGPLIQTILAAFAVNTLIGDTIITRAPLERTGFVDGEEFRVPVEVTYRAFTG